MKFEWDLKKEKTNIQKHKVSFSEAKSVFFDPEALLIADESHSQNEDRFILLGLSEKNRELIVSHCERGNSEEASLIRIISARKADRDETISYWRSR